uniref:non-specific serine/threonine protein kinase n=1 Tax=Oryza barthii TaxID=65489 RepID=A0A0D3H5H2_9ORYZ
MAAMSSHRLLFTQLHLCNSLLLIHVHHATSLNFRFDFSESGSYCTPGSDIACAGDAYPYARTIELTKTDISDRNLRSIGRAWYARPVQLWNNTTGEVASFRTTFSFQIKPVNLDVRADGMAFFLGHYPSGIPHRSYGGNLGLFNGSSNNRNATGTARIVAVEFDTYMNKEWEKDGNHVGIDVNSIVSVAAISPDKNLTSGNTMTAEISYDSIMPPGAAPVPPETVSSEPIMSPGAAVPPEKVSSPRSQVSFVLVCPFMGFLLRRRLAWKRSNGISDGNCQVELDEIEFTKGVGPRRYNYRELAAATGNFAEEKKLGRGGFGHVYPGCLKIDDQERLVAIKRFSPDSSAQGRKEYKIIIGLGSALRYLQQEWEQFVVHGDIKPSNIILGSSYNTKLGDFGLASEARRQWRQVTLSVLGTAGYIDPELVNTRRPSTESDVYSFGIVLLEIVSGRRPVEEPDDSDELFVLSRWVWGLYSKNAVVEAVDERLGCSDDGDDRRAADGARARRGAVVPAP